MNGINDCCYSDGDKHSCCSHQHYCIFNSNRIKLEQQISKLCYDLEYNKQQLSNIRNQDCYTSANYSDTKYIIRILENDLRQLRLFEKKIIDGEIDGYGFQHS